MRELEALLISKTTEAQQKYEASTNAVSILKSLANTVTMQAQLAVKAANDKDDLAEKLVIVNKSLIQVVELCERTATEVQYAGVRFKAEVQLLADLIETTKETKNPEEIAPEPETSASEEELSTPVSEIADENSPEDN